MMWLINYALAGGNSFMPFKGTQIARQVDDLYSFLVISSTISCILLIGGMIYFAFKYKRRSASDKPGNLIHSGLLEFTWSFIPFLIFMFVFGWGWYVYDQMRKPPKDSFEVNVMAKQWSWEFKYKSGRSSPDLVVPVGKPVKLIMTSTDVLHSFFVPAFRIKQDVVPGMFTNVWFNSDYEGEFQVFCTEYCGAKHSDMLAKVKVLSPAAFESWLATDPYKGLSLVDMGKKVYTEKGCVACHTTDGKPSIGPTYKAMFGVSKSLEGGGSTEYDENYIRESILNPNAKTAAGFAKGIMPPFAGQISDQEISAVIEFVKSLR